MRRFFVIAVTWCIAVCFAPFASAAEVNPAPDGFQLGAPLARAHAHNDYAHTHPLWDALSFGFTSIEADIFYHGGRLDVGHTDTEATTNRRRLVDYYIEPLARLANSNDGRIYPCWDGTVQLLVDLKDEGANSTAAVNKVLAEYPTVFAHIDSSGAFVPGAVQVVLSGSYDRDVAASLSERYVFLDGRWKDAGVQDPTVMPLVSDSWSSRFTYLGIGEMISIERKKLDTFVTDAHAAGQRTRFWATPDNPGAPREKLWATLVDAGVDYLNTDDLAAMQKFFEETSTLPPTECPTPEPTPEPTPKPTPEPTPERAPSNAGTSKPSRLPATGGSWIAW